MPAEDKINLSTSNTRYHQLRSSALRFCKSQEQETSRDGQIFWHSIFEKVVLSTRSQSFGSRKSEAIGIERRGHQSCKTGVKNVICVNVQDTPNSIFVQDIWTFKYSYTNMIFREKKSDDVWFVSFARQPTT